MHQPTVSISMAESPFITFAGRSSQSWVAEPDRRFLSEGLFKTRLAGELSDPEVLAFKASIDAAAKAVMEDGLKDLDPSQRTRWTTYLPYFFPQTAGGAATDDIVFVFKRPSRVTIRKTGELTHLKIDVFSADNRLIEPKPYISDGTIIRIAGCCRRSIDTISRKIGVRLDFYAVQIVSTPSEVLGPFSVGF